LAQDEREVWSEMLRLQNLSATMFYMYIRQDTTYILTPIMFGVLDVTTSIYELCDGLFYFANFSRHKFILSLLFLTFTFMFHLSSDNYLKQYLLSNTH